MAWCIVSWATDNSKGLVQKLRELAPESYSALRVFGQRVFAGAGPKLLLATYFERAARDAPRLAQQPVQGHHIDLLRAPEQLATWRAALPAGKVLSVGVIGSRTIWRTDLGWVLRERLQHNAMFPASKSG